MNNLMSKLLDGPEVAEVLIYRRCITINSELNRWP